MAKRAVSKPMGLRNLSGLPDDPRHLIDQGLSERSDILDHDAPIGAYNVDNVVINLLRLGRILRNETKEAIVRHGRIVADISGAASIRLARDELQDPGRYDDCDRLLDYLSKIRRLSSLAQKIAPADVARVVARSDDLTDQGDEIRRAKRAFEIAEAATQSLLQRLDDVDQEIKKFLDQVEYQSDRDRPRNR